MEMMEISEPWVLSLERNGGQGGDAGSPQPPPEWQFGSKVFNLLTLGIVYQGVAFPWFWWMLDKKGNSNTTERIDWT